MLTSKTTGVSVILAVAAFAAGCGSSGSGSSGPSADFAALHQEYASPSAHFQASDVKAVEKALAQQSQSASVPTTMSAKGSSLHIEGTGGTSCTGGSGGVSCSCPGGGSFDETGVSDQGGVVQATVDYDACVEITSTSDTVSISGTLSFADYAAAGASSEMIIYSGTLTETVTPPGSTTTIDLDFALVNGVMTYAVDVSGGNVLVQASGSWDPSTDSGSFTVIDQSGTWQCQLTNGSGTCTGPGGSFSVS